MTPNGSPQWHTVSVDEVLQHLEATPSTGLSEQEVERRRSQYGSNELAEEPGRSLVHDMGSDQ